MTGLFDFTIIEIIHSAFAELLDIFNEGLCACHMFDEN